MIRDFLSSKRQQRRKELRFADVQRLKELGWTEIFTGVWRDPHKRYSYPVVVAIEVCLLRQDIKRNGRSKGFKQGRGKKK